MFHPKKTAPQLDPYETCRAALDKALDAAVWQGVDKRTLAGMCEAWGQRLRVSDACLSPGLHRSGRFRAS